jgi:2-keto-4-pentenoate hydratase/2-oxohepta-3-ene-1,7-dioic acid hydratase in catechol pathway
VILATFESADGSPRLGAVRRGAGSIVDLDAAYRSAAGKPHPAFANMQALIDAGPGALALAEDMVTRSADHAECNIPLSAIRLLAPLPVPRQIRDFSTFETHMHQAGAAMARIRGERTGSSAPLPKPSDIVLPEAFYQQPLYYKCNRFSVVGHEHDIRWPSYARLMDYELEFCAIIGQGGRDIPAAKAGAHIFGYTIFNDFSARDAQEYEMNGPFGPCKGKDFDTGNVFGPWIVTADELTDPYALEMVARINDEEWSRGNSRDMIHRFEDMIAHVSRDETLHPGEVFGSGTVGGGCGLELNRWLKPGDVVELEVEGIGMLRNRVMKS